MAHAFDKICHKAWDVYNQYHSEVGAQNKIGVGVPLFPSSLVTQSYDSLFKTIKLEFPDKAKDLTLIDIVMFITDASEYLQGRGFQATSGLKVIFVTDKEYDKLDKGKLLSIPDDNGLRKYEAIGRDDLVLYYVKNKFEQFKVMVNYMLLGEPHLTIFYFRLGRTHNFPSGYQIGTGWLYSYMDLPESVRQSFVTFKKRQPYLQKLKLEDIGPAAVIPDDLNSEANVEKHNEDSFLKVIVKAVGNLRAREKAILQAKRNVSIIKLFFSGRIAEGLDDLWAPSPWDFYEGTPDVAPDGNLTLNTKKLGIVHFADQSSTSGITFQWEELADPFVSAISSIVCKDEKDQTDLDKAVIKTLDTFSMIDNSTPLHMRFVLCIICLESLLINRREENIGYKLAERISFLVGDAKPWLTYYLREQATDEISNNKMEMENQNLLINARLDLKKKIDEFYNKRSGFAHSGFLNEGRDDTSSITFEDYQIALAILRITIQKLLMLYANGKGIIHIHNRGDKSFTSLEKYINYIKYSGRIMIPAKDEDV